MNPKTKRWTLLLVLLVGAVFGIYQFLVTPQVETEGDTSEEEWVNTIPENDSQPSLEQDTLEVEYLGQDSAEIDRLDQLDQYAFSAPKRKATSVPVLAAYLAEAASNGYEKARLAYAWVAYNIKYDDKRFNSNRIKAVSPADVLRRKSAVCDGYSTLFQALCEEMGVPTLKISGYAKGYGYRAGKRFSQANHAWNAFQVAGQWKLVDVTWGSGYGENVKGKLKSTTRYTPYWFDTIPYEFIFRHFPESEDQQFPPDLLTKSQYEKLTDIHEDIFKLGLPAERILEACLKNPSLKPVKGWKPDYDLTFTRAQINKHLESSKTYIFKANSPENLDLAFINEGEWTFFKKEGGQYIGEIQPSKGELKISSKWKGVEDSYWTILTYEVD